MEPQMEQPKPFFPARKQEWIFGILILIFGWLLCNSVLYAGFQLGFALFCSGSIVCSAGYLCSRGHKLTPYTTALLALSLVITASFARGADGFVKFVMFCFLLVAVNLMIALLSGQNHRKPDGILSLLDAPRVAFMLGLGKTGEAIRGLYLAIRDGGTAGKKGGAVLLGLVIALPLLLILVPLLISADAAFDAVISLLPDWELSELLGTAIFGTLLAGYLYTRAAAAHHTARAASAARSRKGINALTVNTVLVAVAVVYSVYLVSQHAYFYGGISGILPEEFTLSAYARRGFFEMAWLCAINLGIIALAVGLVAKQSAAPLLTRLLCLFIGIVTLFLTVSASAKMLLYIGSYGLTRLRVLTEVIMLFFGLATVFVCIWLFVPKLPYMKAVLLTALIMGAIVAWADVDTQVARYNVTAYQSGQLDRVDVWYLSSLNDAAVPYIARLTQDADQEVAETAETVLADWYSRPTDFRSWNWAAWAAKDYLPPPEN